MALTFRATLPYPPSANAMDRTRIVNTRDGRTFAARYNTHEVKQYRELVRATVIQAGWRGLFQRPVVVRMTAYRPQKRGDLDNIRKVLWDSLNGVVWSDDSLVIEEHAFRSDDPANPRVEIEIREAVPIEDLFA